MCVCVCVYIYIYIYIYIYTYTDKCAQTRAHTPYFNNTLPHFLLMEYMTIDKFKWLLSNDINIYIITTSNASESSFAYYYVHEYRT